MQAAFIKESATLLAGAAVAAVLGIMLGGTMQPQLIFDGHPLGPQMSASGGGARSAGPFDQGGSNTAYPAGMPSYVVGTDHAQAAYDAAAPIAEDLAPRDDAVGDEPEPTPPAPLARAPYDEPPLPEVVYPSVGGGPSYDAETPQPPPPPKDEPAANTG